MTDDSVVMDWRSMSMSDMTGLHAMVTLTNGSTIDGRLVHHKGRVFALSFAGLNQPVIIRSSDGENVLSDNVKTIRILGDAK